MQQRRKFYKAGARATPQFVVSDSLIQQENNLQSIFGIFTHFVLWISVLFRDALSRGGGRG